METEKQTAASPDAGTVMLDFGKLLLETFNTLQNHSHSHRDDDAAERLRIRQEEVKNLLEKTPEAKTVFTFNSDGRLAEPLEAALVAFVSYRVLCADTAAPSLAWSCEVCSQGDTAGLIRCRRVGFNLAKKGILRVANPNGGVVFNVSLAPTYRALRFILGNEGPPAVYNEKMIKDGRSGQTDEGGDVAGGQDSGRSDEAFNIPSAKQLYNEIRGTCIGGYLDEPIRAVASMFFTHMVRSRLIQQKFHPRTPNVTALFIGSSSVGKTFVAETAARSVNAVCKKIVVPFSSFSATDLSAEGYVGCSVEDILKPLLDTCNWDASKARWGCCFLDEIDKKACRTSRGTIDMGRGVQEGLLRMLGGAVIPVGTRRSGWDQKTAQFNCDGTMFVLAGAFVGLDELLRKQKHGGKMGFVADDTCAKKARLRDCLIEYGLLPEMVSRIGSVVVFKNPSLADLEEILRAPLGLITCYSRLLTAMGMEIKLAAESLKLLAEYGIETASYARGMQAAMNRLTEQLVFEGRKGKVRLGEKQVREAIDSMGGGA